MKVVRQNTLQEYIIVNLEEMNDSSRANVEISYLSRTSVSFSCNQPDIYIVNSLRETFFFSFQRPRIAVEPYSMSSRMKYS